MRILVVEDEVRLAATLQDLLELNGYTVDVCHDGEAGLDNALTSIYDVILLDVMLPKLDGLEVARRLRSGSKRVDQRRSVSVDAGAAVENQNLL